MRSRPPIVIGHRGAAAYRPEHTRASYELAARMGADYIEPDLVSTSDGVLVARHENEISGTTDVADRPEFAGRRTTKTIDGRALDGWFTEDFTLAELRTLRARERLPEIRRRTTLFDGRYPILTLREIIELRADLEGELGRRIGIYPETKHPSHFRSIGLPLEEPLVSELREAGLEGSAAPVFVQSFEADSLGRVRAEIGVPLVQLLPASATAPFDFAEIARNAEAVGPWKGHLVPRDEDGRSLEPTSFVAEAHDAGLDVHPYTFRAENAFLPLELRSGDDPNRAGDALAEYRAFYELGVDGVFSDNPDLAVAACGDRTVR